MFGQENCPFCKQSVLKAQVFYEDAYALGMLTHKPITAGHLLIIPKRHVERFEDLSEEEAVSIAQTIKKVHAAASKVYQTRPYLIHQKNGKEVGQHVGHIHFHYIPLKEGNESIFTLIRRWVRSLFRLPMNPSEMQPIKNELERALDSSKI